MVCVYYHLVEVHQRCTCQRQLKMKSPKVTRECQCQLPLLNVLQAIKHNKFRGSLSGYRDSSIDIYRRALNSPNTEFDSVLSIEDDGIATPGMFKRRADALFFFIHSTQLRFPTTTYLRHEASELNQETSPEPPPQCTRCRGGCCASCSKNAPTHDQAVLYGR
jgi:hypothetical protein